jgi:hypothetical protein
MANTASTEPDADGDAPLEDTLSRRLTLNWLRYLRRHPLR